MVKEKKGEKAAGLSRVRQQDCSEDKLFVRILIVNAR